ncbi:MAG: PSD1 and planctomycete cytochrome C domain-containing protein [Opitutaceae bacterium]
MSSLIAASAAPAPIDFNRDVRPILTNNCFACHGFDPSTREAKLRLDERDEATKPTKSGFVPVVPGKPAESEMILRITSTDEEERMPPPDTGKELKPEEIATLRRWISEGAPYAKHWAFSPPAKTPRPAVKRADWPRGAIDDFVLARLEREGIAPSPEADRSTLARRVALDLTGLPPPPELMEAFVQGRDPGAYERFVDALLASPSYGEHWARPWLDLARYADTKGYEKDRQRTIWRYRDWVIDALNADMPYDQFTREQLAGDLLPNPTTSQLIATAFHRNTMTNEEGGVDAEEYRIIAVKDRVDTTVQAWMGLTMGCAKCHTHKYDPISIRDYYSFYAFFNQTEDANRGNDVPTLPTLTAEEREQTEKLTTAIAGLEARFKEEIPQLAASLPDWETAVRASAAWRFVRPSLVQTASGVRSEVLADGAVLVKSAAVRESETETYTVKFSSDLARISAVRLEVLPDASHPRGGVGRSDNEGSFVLTGIKLVARAPDGSESEIPFVAATADFSAADFPIEHVLKNPDPKKHGWSVKPRNNDPHVAIFTTSTPRELPAGAEFVLTVEHQFPRYGESLGKFRVALTADPAPVISPVVSDAIAAIVRLAPEQRTDAQHRELLEYLASVAPQTRSVRQELAHRKSELASARRTTTPIMRELAVEKRRETRLHNRGNFLDPGDPVEPAVLAAFHPLPEGAPNNRLGVAEWLCRRENPLTARVAANRIWAQLFGLGLVETQEDFGSQGTPPSHPAVLDWLAVELMDNGWSLKQLVKTVVMSATYRQSSNAPPSLIERDRFNRLLARGPRFRLDAEALRDQALAVSGLLSPKMHGPSVMPYQPPGLWKSTYSSEKWKTSTGEDRHRRGLYTFIKRTTPYPAMLMFDGTSRETCTVRRSRTNTPLQALVMLNDPVFVECAQALARKMNACGDARIDKQLAAGLRAALLREPWPREIEVIAELYRQRLEVYRRDSAAAEKIATNPLGPPPAGADVAHLAALTAVANVVLNLDEFVTKH